jgi:hypothetical protein
MAITLPRNAGSIIRQIEYSASTGTKIYHCSIRLRFDALAAPFDAREHNGLPSTKERSRAIVDLRAMSDRFLFGPRLDVSN